MNEHKSYVLQDDSGHLREHVEREKGGRERCEH